MKALVFNTKELAETQSNAEALRRGCSGVTSYWWPIREMANGQYAMMVEDDLDGTELEVDIEILGEDDFPSFEEKKTITQSLVDGTKKLLGL